jgi:hypothetical protein
LGNTGFDSSNVAAESAKAGGFFQLGAGLLEAQIENFLAQIPAFSVQFSRGFLLNVFALFFLHNPNVGRALVTGNKFGFNWQLGRGEAQRLAGNRFSDTIHLEKHIGRPNDRDPGLQRPLSFTHPSFQRFLGERFLRENANPHFAVALHVTRDRHAGSLDLPDIQPATLQGHQAELAESHGVTAGGKTSAAAAVHLAIFYSIWNRGHIRRKLTVFLFAIV